MPSPDEIRAAQIKQTRRGILDVLNMSYPVSLAFETIVGAFVDIEEHYLRRDLTYLCDAGYVMWLNPLKNAPWKGRIYKLTPRGEEIASRINTDPALTP